MDGKFSNFAIEELETLLSDMKAGLQPSNIVLSEVVTRELRRQYDRANPPSLEAIHGF